MSQVSPPDAPDQGRSFTTARPVAILMVFLAAIVFGALSYSRLPVTLMPELSYPTLTVRTEYEGAAPEEVENDITRPIEEAVGVVGGLRRLSSVSRAGISDVVLEFSWDTDMGDAAQDVLEKLDLVFLPEEADRPLILHFDPSLDPIMELSLAGESELFEGEAGQRRLRRLAELQVKRALEPVKGVAAVRVKGGLEEEIHVSLDEEALRRSGLSIQTVIERLRQENVNLAGGSLQEGRTEYMVRTLNEFENIDQIADAVVARFEGREVRVRDVAEVRWSNKDREIATRTDGSSSVQIEIFKEGDANIVAVAQQIRALIGETPDEIAPPGGGDEGKQAQVGPRGLGYQLLAEEGARIEVVADRSLFIKSSIDEVRNTAILGGLLAIVVLFLFLKKAKPTAIIAVSIPISLLVTFAPLNLMGVSLNIMSLGGLALGIGMLVDSSIVVLESIYRCRDEGDAMVAATERGTREVRAAVLASTLTSIAVFLPMVIVEGVAGQAFGDLGLAVVVSLLVSAIVALFFIPMLASRGGVRRDESAEAPRTLGGRFKAALLGSGQWRRWGAWSALASSWKDSRILVKLLVIPPLYWVLRFLIGGVLELVGKILLTVLALVSFVLPFLLALVGGLFALVTWPLKKVTDLALGTLQTSYPALLRWALGHPLLVLAVVAGTVWGTWQLASDLDSELLPEVYQGEFTVEVALPVGTPLEETERLLTPIENAILEERANIRSMILTLGYDSATSQRSDEGEHTARFKVLLDDVSRNAEVERAVIERLRARFEGLPDVEARVVRPVLFSQRTPIEVEIHGEDLVALRQKADEVQARLAALPELADVETTQRRGAPEVQIVYDRDRLALYDLNIGDVARLVRDKVQGYEATRFNMKDRRIPIIVRLQLSDRETVDDVRRVVVNPGMDTPIPLSAVADVTLGEGPSEVRRIDGQRVAVVRANLGEGSLSAGVAAIDSTLSQRVDWPADMDYFIGGQSEEWERSSQSLWLALALSIFLVYVIMAAQFESLVHPLVIMLTIPLAFIGTVLAMRLLSINLSVVVFLGMIMLAGIVVNNAIVLIDYINTLRRRGLPRDEAIVRAGGVRLRPILMTTATTVLGLLPLALGFGDGAELRSPMAIAVISGLITSTALTLVLIPTVYALADDAVAVLSGRRRERSRSEGGLEAPRGAESVTP